jgi:hypothetical protein
LLRVIVATSTAIPVWGVNRSAAAGSETLPEFRLWREGKGGRDEWLRGFVLPDGRAEALLYDGTHTVRSRRSGVLGTASRSALKEQFRRPEVAPLLNRDHFFEIYPEPVTRDPNLIIEHLHDTSFGLRIRGAGRPE